MFSAVVSWLFRANGGRDRRIELESSTHSVFDPVVIQNVTVSTGCAKPTRAVIRPELLPPRLNTANSNSYVDESVQYWKRDHVPRINLFDISDVMSTEELVEVSQACRSLHCALDQPSKCHTRCPHGGGESDCFSSTRESEGGTLATIATEDVELSLIIQDLYRVPRSNEDRRFTLLPGELRLPPTDESESSSRPTSSATTADIAEFSQTRYDAFRSPLQLPEGSFDSFSCNRETEGGYRRSVKVLSSACEATSIRYDGDKNEKSSSDSSPELYEPSVASQLDPSYAPSTDVDKVLTTIIELMDDGRPSY